MKENQKITAQTKEKQEQSIKFGNTEVTISAESVNIKADKINIKGSKEDYMSKFEALKSITDNKKFSELIYDILKDKNSPQEVFEFLSQELTEKEIQTLKFIAENGYPLSLEGRQ